jgi:hypothetical protein
MATEKLPQMSTTLRTPMDLEVPGAVKLAGRAPPVAGIGRNARPPNKIISTV